MTVALEVGGRTRVVDVVPVPSGWSLLLDGRSYELAFEEQQGRTTLYVNGQPIAVTLAGARRAGRPRTADPRRPGPRGAPARGRP